jgi:Uma2 family endonuclease
MLALPSRGPSGEQWCAGLPESLNLPASLCAGLRLTPDQFAELCQANPDAVLEQAADGSLICMTPTGSETCARNADRAFQIQAWARATGSWKGFDSSSGIRLPDNSVLSPAASPPCARKWPPIRATAPGSAGC